MARKVQPLRISKGTPNSSPQKMATGRPLSEISAGSMRRNSPSYNQATRKMMLTREASPYTENTMTKASPRDFWSLRDPLSPTHLDVENSFTESLRSPSPNGESHSPRRRPSVEKLQQASRVKNSKIFELENKAVYDPASTPIVERPAANRPLSENFANNSFTRMDSLRKENGPIKSPQRSGHKRSDSQTLEAKTSSMPILPTGSPFSSPTKSALSRSSQFGSRDNSMLDNSISLTEDDRSSTPRPTLHRHHKSVTFETDPPTINEYEQPTPEPSVAATSEDSRDNTPEGDGYLEGDSYDLDSSMEQDDSFDADLENADKTPVVLPEHWADDARRDLIDDGDDVFESSVIHNPAQDDTMRRSVSVASDGSSRPLPPLPNKTLRKKESRRELVERAESEELVIRNLDTGETKELHVRINEAEVHDDSVVAELEDFAASPPRISRESILRKVRGSKYDFDDEDDIEDDTFESAVDHGRPSYAELARFDPDQPVPSREDDLTPTIEKQEVIIERVQIKTEIEDVVDLSSVPHTDASFQTPEMSRQEERSSVIRNALAIDSDEDSAYSPASSETIETAVPAHTEPAQEPESHGETLQDAMALLTVKDYSESTKKTAVPDFMSLPSYLANDDWVKSMQTYCSPEEVKQEIKPAVLNAFESAPILAPSHAEEVDTPESAMRHVSDPISELAPGEDVVDEEQFDGTHRPVSPVVPERKATIKTNGRLKARPSGTPADFEALLSEPIDLEENPVPPMPATDFARSLVASAEEATGNSKLDLSLDIPEVQQDLAVEGDMLGLDREFDRVIETQKKGYLTRQNTKVVVASNRNFSGESDETVRGAESGRSSSKSGAKTSPRKPSAEQHFKAEPWNGKQRRKSLRNASAQQANDGPAPPLPGQQSALGTVNEDRSLLDDTDPATTERGRLFIKVVGVQDLAMPLPRNDRVDFKLTLDNGLHCVTTPALELGQSAAIGQEFELVVQNDLEFQLTLSTRLPPPIENREEPTRSAPASPSKQSKSTFSRLLSSPKKRAEKERQEREAQEAAERQRKEDIARKRASQQPSAWDLMRELVNSADGSFARAYVNLGNHENECFGRKLEVSVPLYNEWALEKDDAVVSSIRSKRGANCGPIRRPPYVIGQLICQLLYVPKPKDATDEELPKSMSSAVREISKATEVVEVTHEGFLSQQGGDCVHWRRRFFSVSGSKLTAYHENTHQKRAVINLTKASRLVDDRRTLVADPAAATKKSGRRKSAFAEEDEGYQYVEEGFRIRFANGETIDFYADSRAEKDTWMEVLAQVIGKPAQSTRKQRWTDVVLAHEKATGKTVPAPSAPTPTTEVQDFAPAPPAKDTVRKPVQAKSTPSSPAKSRQRYSHGPSPVKRPGTPPLEPRTDVRKRNAVKSMIF